MTSRHASTLAASTALWIAAAALASPPDLSSLLVADRRVLPNGLEVLLHEDHRLNVVMVSVVYHVGAVNEPAGRSGFAHLFEHLMFEGSQHANSGYLGLLATLAPVDANGFTRPDFTEYFELVPAANLPAALWLESDRMGFLGPALDDVKLSRAKEVVKNERREKVDLAPYGLAVEAMDQALFPEPHPYHGHGIGNEADLDRAALAEVRTFFDTWYVPANATLALVGDFKTDDAMAWVTKYFFDLPGRPRPIKTLPAEVHLGREVVVHHAERLGTLPAVFMAWHAPPVFTDGDAVGHIVGDLLTRRLEQHLVTGARLAEQVSAWQTGQPGQSVFTVRALAGAGVPPKKLIAAIDEEIDRLRRGDVANDELATAVLREQTEIVGRFDSSVQVERIAHWMQEYNHHLGTPDWVSHDQARFAAIQPAQIAAFARAVLLREGRVVVIAEPPSGGPK